jgi:hypothetical protein
MKNLFFLPFVLLAAVFLIVYAWWPDEIKPTIRKKAI